MAEELSGETLELEIATKIKRRLALAEANANEAKQIKRREDEIARIEAELVVMRSARQENRGYTPAAPNNPA